MPLGIVRRLRNPALNAAIRLGLLPYRKPFPVDTTQWDEDYSTDELDFYAAFRERARYGILLGYLTARQAELAILDVGCGVGLMRERIPDHLIGRFCGCDPSAVAIEEARGRGWFNSEFHVEAMPSAELGQFDVIICNEMLYYVDDVDALLLRLASMLKPDGWLLSSVTRHAGDFVLHQKIDRHFNRLDAVTLKSEVAALKWRLACHGKTEHQAGIRTGLPATRPEATRPGAPRASRRTSRPRGSSR